MSAYCILELPDEEVCAGTNAQMINAWLRACNLQTSTTLGPGQHFLRGWYVAWMNRIPESMTWCFTLRRHNLLLGAPAPRRTRSRGLYELYLSLKDGDQ